MAGLTINLKPNMIVRGPILAEPVQVIVAIPIGDSVKLIGKGLRTGQVHEPVLSPQQLASLEITPEQEPFDGDAKKFRLGIEALRLGLAYEYDPYFTLSTARVDPLPHQLEAVYDYFLKLSRIRFLLADDPGAGKTIMAGLLVKELKIRGPIRRVLIVTPAKLSFHWQCEMKDKFREHLGSARRCAARQQHLEHILAAVAREALERFLVEKGVGHGQRFGTWHRRFRRCIRQGRMNSAGWTVCW